MDPRGEISARAANDLGGLPAGPLAATDHVLLPWEKSTTPCRTSSPSRASSSVEEKRRGIDELGRDVYDRLTYYEKWILSVSNNLLAKGVITSEELARKLEQVAQREAGRGREVCP